MIKKIVLGLIFTLIAGVLVVGAVNRTAAKSVQYHSAQTSTQTGNGGGQNRDGERQYANQQEPLYLEKEQGTQEQNGRFANAESTNQNTNTPLGDQGQGYQGGNGQNGQNSPSNVPCEDDCDTQPLNQTVHDDFLTFQGTVTTVPAAGIEMVIQTTEGLQPIATGPAQWLQSSIILVVGDDVTVTGFWEDGEFKATTLTRASDSLTVILRDETGRPMWSGSARSGSNQGQGQGQKGQGQGQSN